LFGIKIWKPALYQKHRSIDSHSYQDLHEQPGSQTTNYLSANLLWPLLFGWWIAAVYILIAVMLCPVWLIGELGLLICSCGNIYRRNIIINPFVNAKGMKDYIVVLLNLAAYIFWPFGKFVAKRINVPAQSPVSIITETAPLIATFEREPQFDLPPALMDNSSVAEYETFDTRIGLEFPSELPRSALDNDNWSDSEPSIRFKNHKEVWLVRLIKKSWKSGVSGFTFFLVCFFVLGPIHLIVSAICYFLIVSIPMGKLNYYLLRYLLQHPLQLMARSCNDSSHIQAHPIDHDGEGESSRTTQRRGKPPSIQCRSRTVFFWHQDTTEDVFSKSTTAETQNTSHVPPIMATPSFTTNRVRTQNSSKCSEYLIVLCTYRAIGIQYLKYTVVGVNIIFINLLSMIVFTILNFYAIGPMNGYTGVSSKSGIFFAGIISTIPLAYFIGMSVSSITATTGSVAVGAVINATFGSIIEIILYAFGLMDGKEDLVQGAMIGSLLCGLLALPGVSMFSGGLKRAEQRFNSKSASVTSTMLVVSLIGVFAPTVFHNIHGTYQFDCQNCPENNVIAAAGTYIFSDGKTCRSCHIYQPHPTEDPIYLTHTRPLMYLCAIILVLTYAIGLLFTLHTHRHRIYPQKRQKKDIRFSKMAVPIIEEQIIDHKGKIPSNQKRHTQLHQHSKKNQRDDASTASSESEVHHGNPGWGLITSTAILLGCTILYTVIAEILIDCLDDLLVVFPMREKTIGLTIFAVVPTVTEFCN
jgi:Ca2+:H+ antiporter